MSKNIRISTPAGTTGIAVEPWAAGEIYAVAADWAQASSQVMTYGPDGWDSTQYQVADFRHNDRAALESIIRDAIQMGGDEPDDDDVESIMDDAAEIDDQTAERSEMADMLDGHGERFSGGNVDDIAQGWLEHDFDARSAGEWCEIGVWDDDTAAEFRDADLTPDEVNAAADRMIEAAEREYTDGSPIYAACNGDISAQQIIDAAKE